MPWRKWAAKASFQNIHTYFSNQNVQKNQDDVEGEFTQCHQRNDLMVAAAAQAALRPGPPTDSNLDPELTVIAQARDTDVGGGEREEPECGSPGQVNVFVRHA